MTSNGKKPKPFKDFNISVYLTSEAYKSAFRSKRSSLT